MATKATKETTKFEGFPRAAVKFFADLGQNNERDWFNDNKQVYEESVLAPARAFVVDMGKRVKKLSPTLNADPANNGSIFRIYRDTRFSKDKTPYKTHLGIFFWEGKGKKKGRPGYYFHLSPPTLMVGVGMKDFPKPVMDRFRKAVDNDTSGKELVKAIAAVEKKGYKVGGAHYKRVPRGFDPDHARAELLKFGTIHAMKEGKIPKELHSAALLDYCEKVFKEVAPLEKWMAKYLTP